jgi:Domain of unknown function (DUF6378)
MVAKRTQRVVQRVVAAMSDATPETARQAILDEASELTHQSRNTAYGNPEDNFNNIANLWTAYWRSKFPGMVNFDAHDVAIMMILMKTARLATNPNHHDSCVDIAGYAACLGDVQAAAIPQTPVEPIVSTNETNERTLRRR